MTGKKEYKPLTVREAYDFLVEELDGDPDMVMTNLSTRDSLVYAEILKLHKRIDEIENQATEMMSPDAMMNMAQNFLGGGLVP